MTAVSVYAQQHKTMISGKVVSKEKEIIDLATVYLKGTNYGCMTNEQGIYHLHAPAGEYTLVVSAVGYETIEKPVKLFRGERVKMNVVLASSVTELDEVVVVSNGVGRVKRSAFNAVAVDTEELQNSTKNLSDALSKLPGMKLREAGGVGSDTQLMLDGFSGKHVKVFIDGVPQEGVGSSFGLNNIPVNFAERIEVYKGVVPVGFGSDALGGAINIDQQTPQRMVSRRFLFLRFLQHAQIADQLRPNLASGRNVRDQRIPKLFGQLLLCGHPRRTLPRGRKHQPRRLAGRARQTVQRHLPQ